MEVRPDAPAGERQERLRSMIAAARRQAAGAGSSFLPAGAVTPNADGLFPGFFPGYELSGDCHRGGQGVVYQAIQKSTQRSVAIKVLKEGPFAGRANRTRFEREIQILGALQHPGIVTIHDSGSAAGSFYFVMDYITGVSLDEWDPSTDARHGRRSGNSGLAPRIECILRLFAEICDSVNAAHLLGIVHRDLKPSNIRVDAEGRAHVLDFGLAKASQAAADDSGAPAMTLTGQFVGSLPWASPEQARGAQDHVDTRSDVYSLGVVLYQLLTGRFPYAVAGSLADVLTNIQNEPPAPPRAVRRDIDDELQTIVLCCLAKEPERRYETAGALGADLRRYLAGEPIAAKRDAFGYLLWKTVRRHRAAVATAITFVILIAVGLIATLVLWRQAAGERDRAVQAEDAAELRRAQSEAVTAFLNDDLLASAAPSVESGRGKDVKMRDVLAAAAERIQGRFEEQPEVEASVRHALGGTYLRLGEFAAAEPHLLRSLELRRGTLGEEHEQTLAAMNLLAMLYAQTSRYAEAESIRVKECEMSRRALGADHSNTLSCINNLGTLYINMGRYAEAEKYFNESLDGLQRTLGPEHENTLMTINNLASVFYWTERYEEAEATLLPALEAERRLFGPDHAVTQMAVNTLILIYNATNRLDEAEALGKELLAVRRRILGDEHPLTLLTSANLAFTCMNLGRDAEAESLYDRLLETQRRLYGDEHADTLVSMLNLANVYLNERRFDECEALLLRTRDGMRRTLGEGHPNTLASLNGLAQACLAQDRLHDAEAHYRAALDAARNSRPPGDATIRAILELLAPVLMREQKYAEAETCLREAQDIRIATLPPDDTRRFTRLPLLGEALLRQEKFDEAERVLLDVNALMHGRPDVPAESRRAAFDVLIELYDLWHAAEPGKGCAERAADWRGKRADWEATTQAVRVQADSAHVRE